MKPIVFAGNHHIYTRYCRENDLDPRRDAIYAGNGNRARGMEIDSPIVLLHDWCRQIHYNILSMAAFPEFRRQLWDHPTHRAQAMVEIYEDFKRQYNLYQIMQRSYCEDLALYWSGKEYAWLQPILMENDKKLGDQLNRAYELVSVMRWLDQERSFYPRRQYAMMRLIVYIWRKRHNVKS